MGKSGQRHAQAVHYPRRKNPGTLEQEAGWAPEPVWTQRLEGKSSAGDRTLIVLSSSPQSENIPTELPRLPFCKRKRIIVKARKCVTLRILNPKFILTPISSLIYLWHESCQFHSVLG
jgi:hypothetical protein